MGKSNRRIAFYANGWAFLHAHTERIPWLVYRKIRLLADPFYMSDWLSDRLYNLWYAWLIPFLPLGLWVSIRRQPVWSAVVLCALLELVFVTALFHGYARYRFPYEPLLLPWCVAGVVWLWQHVRKGWQRPAFFAAYTLLHVAVLVKYLAQ